MRTVIVAEKRSLANAIAKVLKEEISNVAGHIFKVTYRTIPEKGWLKTPLKSLLQDPLIYKPSQYARASLKNLDSCCTKPIDHLVLATDPDQQGHKIGQDIYRYMCKKTTIKKASRMMLESVTKNAIVQAYSKMDPLDESLSYSADLRARLDFLLGTILTRYASLTQFKRRKAWVTYNTGRVQTPTLKFVIDREKQIKDFVPEEKTYLVLAQQGLPRLAFESSGESGVYPVELIKDQAHEVPAQEGLNTDRLMKLLAKDHAVFKKLGKPVADLLSKMYLSGLISYPRTDNIYYKTYPDLYHTAKNLYQEHYDTKAILSPLTPVKNTDHGPITPLVSWDPSDASLQGKVLKTLYNHLPKIFSGSNRYRKLTYLINLGQQKPPIEFQVYEPIEVRYKDSLSPVSSRLPGKVPLVKEVRWTKPKALYTASTLLSKMKAAHIGTKSTRASILSELEVNKYVFFEKNFLKSTTKGRRLIEFWNSNFRDITDPQLTKQIEKTFKQIRDENHLLELEKSYRKYLSQKLEI